MVSFSRAGGDTVGAPFSLLLSPLTPFASYVAGVDAGIVGPDVVFVGCTTWSLSRRIGPLDGGPMVG